MTVTSRADLQRAMQEAMQEASSAGPHGPRLSGALPPIRLQLVPVASEVRRLSFGGGTVWDALFDNSSWDCVCTHGFEASARMHPLALSVQAAVDTIRKVMRAHLGMTRC